MGVWQTPFQADIPPGQTPPPPQQMATAVDGMHPTGMHSCFAIFFAENERISTRGRPWCPPLWIRQ